MAIDPASAYGYYKMAKKAKKHWKKAAIAIVAVIGLIFGMFTQFMFGSAEAYANGSCGAVGSGSYVVNTNAEPNTSIANIIYSIGEQRNVSEEVMKAAFIVAYIETEPGPRNQASSRYAESLSYPHDYVTSGDGRSIGIYQQQVGGSGRDGKPWGTIAQMMDPAYAAGRFFDSAAVAVSKGKTSYEDIAHFVQVSAHPEKYTEARYTEPAFRLMNGAKAFNSVDSGIELVTNKGWLMPLAGNPQITSPFGPRKSPGGKGSRNHRGTDYGAVNGTPVLAINAGRVIKASPQVAGNLRAGWGNVVQIDHGSQITSVYAHLSAYRVQEGDQVAPGQVIALSGNTGTSTGPHLHLEIWNGNADPKQQDPAAFLATQGATVSEGGTISCGAVDGSLVDPGGSEQGADMLTDRTRNAKLVYEGRYGCATRNNAQPCVAAIGGWRESSASGNPDHREGRALDIMVSSLGQRASGPNEMMGQQIADFTTANAANLGVSNVIWQQRIWSVERPTWRPMGTRGSATADHFDHVHVSFKK